MTARVEELAATRADAITAHGAELRRIERDAQHARRRLGLLLHVAPVPAGAGRVLGSESAGELVERAQREGP
ncbi:hypothetical protein [Streptomyces sp. YKOK-I1]